MTVTHENNKVLYLTSHNKNNNTNKKSNKLVYVDSEDFSKEIQRLMSYESYYGTDNYY